jgi:hypothetical protein
VACPDSVYTAQGFWHTLRQGRRTWLVQCRRILSSIEKNRMEFIKHHYCMLSWCRHDEKYVNINRYACVKCLPVCVHPQGGKIIFQDNWNVSTNFYFPQMSECFPWLENWSFLLQVSQDTREPCFKSIINLLHRVSNSSPKNKILSVFVGKVIPENLGTVVALNRTQLRS